RPALVEGAAQVDGVAGDVDDVPRPVEDQAVDGVRGVRDREVVGAAVPGEDAAPDAAGVGRHHEAAPLPGHRAAAGEEVVAPEGHFRQPAPCGRVDDGRDV